MKRVVFLLLISFLAFACKKESEDTQPSHSNNTSVAFDVDGFDCEYIIESPPEPIIELLENPDDAQEQLLDTYMYYIARALSKFTCEHDNYASAYQNIAFSRYTDPSGNPDLDLEVEVRDLYNIEPIFQIILDDELSSLGLDWSTIENSFTWEGINYIPVIYLENGAVASWELDPYVGIGTDIDVGDVLADFIPVLHNGCAEESNYEPTELMIGKVDPQIVASLPEPIEYEAECLENPLLIVQLGWAKGKKSTAQGNPNLFGGTTVDNPPYPPPSPSCDLAYHYILKAGTLGGQRFERDRRSEYSLEIFTIPEGTGNIGIYPYYSRREHLKRVHKNDKHNIHGFYHEFFASNSLSFVPGVGALPVGPFPSASPSVGHYVYAITYEYDWYCKNRNITFDSYRGVTPKMKLRRKGGHQHYQIMCITPPDWCDREKRRFTITTGNSLVEATL